MKYTCYTVCTAWWYRELTFYKWEGVKPGMEWNRTEPEVEAQKLLLDKHF